MSDDAGTSGEASATLKEHLRSAVGMVPTDALGWLFVARGMFNSQPPRYEWAIAAASHTLRHPQTMQEGQHILAFSLHELGQLDAAKPAFERSIHLGNESDWQMVVEIGIDQFERNQKDE